MTERIFVFFFFFFFFFRRGYMDRLAARLSPPSASTSWPATSSHCSGDSRTRKVCDVRSVDDITAIARLQMLKLPQPTACF